MSHIHTYVRGNSVSAKRSADRDRDRDRDRPAATQGCTIHSCTTILILVRLYAHLQIKNGRDVPLDIPQIVAHLLQLKPAAAPFGECGT